jgi:hypothetical protein
MKHEVISTSNEENTSEQEHKRNEEIHPLKIKLNIFLKNFRSGNYSKALDLIKSIYSEAYSLSLS